MSDAQAAPPAVGPQTPPPGKNKTLIILIVVALAIVAVPIGIAVIGIVAAIAIPSFLRARISANEAAAIGDARTILSAEAAYQASSGGTYGTLECLANPGSCVAGYTGPSFLDRSMTQAVKVGYKRRLTLSADATSYVFIAEPVRRNETGMRAFCGDSNGSLCATSDGSRPQIRDGECDLSSCQPLR